MPKTWAISGVDLHLDLDGTRVRGAFESALRDAVRSGRLGAGVRLPSSRALAADLGLARNTVAAAYSQLVAEGWLEARQGAGTRVAERAAAAQPPPAAPPPAAARHRHDLRPGVPDLASFPVVAWIAAARRALRAAPADALGYGDPRGRPELRAALAGYLARARGVDCDADSIVVCSGFAQGLSLLCRGLLELGATSFATESHCHRSHHGAVAASGLVAATVPVDAAGAVIAELGAAGGVLLTPAHQFPLGVPLAAHRRTAAVAWARETGAVVVEDDYDGEFRYDRRPLGAMQALAPDHVVYAGTASKSLAPGLRLGWLVLPPRLLEPVLAARRLTDGPGALDQLTLAELISTGAFDRHVRRSRLACRRRRDRLVSTLRRRVPAARVTGIEAGLHAVVELPAVDDELAVVRRAHDHGLMLEGLDEYRVGGEPRPAALVVGYGTPPEHAFSAAVARLCAVLARG
jgi:GntR family transcriptional regulator / MocR family aminotransferase